MSKLDEVLEKINGSLRQLTVEIIASAESDVETEIEMFIEPMVDLIKRELKNAGLKCQELDAEAVSNDTASGIGFRWTVHEVPVCICGETELWLRYVAGYSQNSPYILKRFEIIKYQKQKKKFLDLF